MKNFSIAVVYHSIFLLYIYLMYICLTIHVRVLMAIVVTHSAISRGVDFIVLWCKPWVLGHHQTQERLKINPGYGNCINNDSCLQYLFSIIHIFSFFECCYFICIFSWNNCYSVENVHCDYLVLLWNFNIQ